MHTSPLSHKKEEDQTRLDHNNNSNNMTYLQKPSYTISIILLLPLALLTLTFLLPYPSYLRAPFLTNCHRASELYAATAAAPDFSDDPEFRILIGVHTMAKKHSRRHLIRMAYELQQTPALRRVARVDMRFVLCRLPMTAKQRAFLALEVRAYGDVLVFNCTESAADGKTYSYFAELPEMFNGVGGAKRPYDYAMKVDDDTYLRLDELVETLRGVAREDMYYGVGLPFQDKKFPPFMLGMGYILSWDLVQWIASSDMVRREAKGIEDMTTGKWLNMGNKAKNRYNIYPRMYDYRGAQAGDFLQDTIGVHQLKDDFRWAHTLEHFNATQLEPSKLHNF